MRLLCFFLALASPGFAQELPFAAVDGDEALAENALQQRLSGQTLTFYDDGVSKYYVDGRYSYTYAQDGGTAYGYWSISNGAVCVEFLNGFSRCDMIVQNGNRLILLDERGDRYPIRP